MQYFSYKQHKDILSFYTVKTSDLNKNAKFPVHLICHSILSVVSFLKKDQLLTFLKIAIVKVAFTMRTIMGYIAPPMFSFHCFYSVL